VVSPKSEYNPAILVSVLITKSCADSEHLVQEQTLALIHNFVDGYVDSANYVIDEDEMILDAISRQLNNASALGVCIQVAFLHPLFN
jgi:armadillo repeat-containing protein 8